MTNSAGLSVTEIWDRNSAPFPMPKSIFFPNSRRKIPNMIKYIWSQIIRSIRVVERLALPTSNQEVAGSNPAGGEILPEPKRRFIAQSLSCSPFHRLEMTEILSKGRKTLTHPSQIIPNLKLQTTNPMRDVISTLIRQLKSAVASLNIAS